MKLGLRLYITGSSPFSESARKAIQQLQIDYPHIDFDLEVIDVVESPTLAAADDIAATPTLLKLSPLPVRKIVGDLSNLPHELDLDEKMKSSQTPEILPQSLLRNAFESTGSKT